MKVYAIDHVQLAMPANGEARARSFYAGVLGLRETPKPAHLAVRGGVWFEQDGLKLHLGVEVDFRPARKAHVGLLVDELDALISRCELAGYTITKDEPLEGYRRVYVNDPFGNRVELMQLTSAPGKA
jgi:catechol 2,3-dioxygenase-like lactoylglutathione lyase family enzyme